MAFKPMFFVQIFGIDSKNRLVGGRSFAVADAVVAVQKAKALSENVVGVVAFAQMVDQDAGDAEEPTLLALFGRVPAEARAVA